MRSNASTPMDQNGWADVIGDIRQLYAALEGGTNDLNQNSVEGTQNAIDAGAAYLKKALNLADVPDKVAARDNLGVTSAITNSVTVVSSGAAYLAKANNLSDLTTVATALTNLTINPTNFFAYGSATQNLAGADEVLQFNTELFDVGGYYATGTYKFTPRAGKYLIGFNLVFQQSISGFATDVNYAYLDHEDGRDYGRAVVSKTAINTDYSLSHITLAEFSGSQYVRVKMSIDSTFYSNNTTTLRGFWGVRLSA